MATPFSKHTALKGSEKAAPKGKKKPGIDKKELINVTVKLRPGSALPNLLNPQVYEKFTPISHEEFAQRYGSRAEDIQLVTRFAHHAGLSIAKSEPHKRTMELRGSIGQMEKAFKVKLDNFKGENAHLFRGRKGEIQIPTELSGVVEGIFGLDTRPIAKPKFKVFKPKKKSKSKKSSVASGYYPTDISKIYNFPQQLTGSGQCIGIIELGGGYRAADIDAYFTKLNLKPPKLTAVSVDGAHNTPGNPNGADGEVMLDIEVAGGIAPDASIAVYFAGNTDKAFLDAINQAVHDTTNNPSAISISWGSAEGAAGGWNASSMDAFNQAFQSAAILGITVFAAAGDNGSNDNVGDGKVHVDFPAASPYVLACGGTLISTQGDAITSEVVWHESDGGASGGGVSDVFPLPDYQQHASVDLSVNTGKSGRGVPDLAADADPASGYNVRVDGKNMLIGGTSAVAPMMAGLLSLINQGLNKKSGFIHPKLYSNPSVCRDITEGNNITTSTQKGYSARVGWDACSGMGAPDGSMLMGIL